MKHYRPADSDAETVAFARDELARYLALMSGDEHAEHAIKVGLCADIGDLADEKPCGPERDGFWVDVRQSTGYIAGSNGWSVLHGVYRFLAECGCRWVRPGVNGEFIPVRSTTDITVALREVAVHEFRGFNDCGAYPLENLLDKLDWAPKVGLNTFMSEFFSKDHFYNRFYEHPIPSLMQPGRRSPAEAAAFQAEVERAVRKRGLTYHAIGHGWTGKVLGLSDSECSTRDDGALPVLSPEQSAQLALVDGQRRMHPRGPVFTELCIGNPQNRRRLVKEVADYASTHPCIDVLHVWASDSFTANCECELCRDSIPADTYVTMLNELDGELADRGLETKIGFLIYGGGQLLFPPASTTISNASRFVMMFAAVSRDYREPYTMAAEPQLPEFVLNEAHGWTQEENLASLLGWRSAFSGPAFTFEYQFTWYHYLEPGYFGIATNLVADVDAYPTLGLNGHVGCEVVASHFPTDYPHALMARKLFAGEVDETAFAADYFEAAFGEDGGTVSRYLLDISEAFTEVHPYRGPHADSGMSEGAVRSAEAALSRTHDLARGLRPVAERNLDSPVGVHRESWQYLLVHLDYVPLLADAVRVTLARQQELGRAYWRRVYDFLAGHEEKLVPVFDLWWFRHGINHLIVKPDLDAVFG